MATHFGRIGAVVKGEVPYNKEEVVKNAAIVAMMSGLPWQAFGPGTEVGDTRAKPEIWREQAKFNDAANKMQMEMGKVVVAGKSGNLDSLKQEFGGAAQSCKACHDAYRKD